MGAEGPESLDAEEEEEEKEEEYEEIEEQQSEVIEVEDDDILPELPPIWSSQLNKALKKAQLKKKRQLLAL